VLLITPDLDIARDNVGLWRHGGLKSTSSAVALEEDCCF
jgi:hypothetical protein